MRNVLTVASPAGSVVSADADAVAATLKDSAAAVAPTTSVRARVVVSADFMEAHATDPSPDHNRSVT
jgi:hypothetical protein